MNITTHPVVASLTPVFLLIGTGYLAGRLNWIRDAALKDLSNLVFLLLIPALLFRTMSSVHIEELDLRPVAAYFSAAIGLLLLSIALLGFDRRSVIVALAGTFSNMAMIGITLVELAYGQAALVTLLTLLSVHALILLTLGSVLLELTVAQEAALADERKPHMFSAAWMAFRGAVIHPIPLPIFFGLLFAQTGWALPEVVDRPLQLLGSAFGPLALVLVGATLSHTTLKGHWRAALWISVCKNVVLPILVGALAWMMGIRGLPLTVMVLAAGLPMGANMFLFAQRYQTAQGLITASMGVSTVLAVLSLSAWMFALSLWPLAQ